MCYAIKGKFTGQERRIIHRAMAALNGAWHDGAIWTIRRACCDRRRCYAAAPFSPFAILGRDVVALMARLASRVSELQARNEMT